MAYYANYIWIIASLFVACFMYFHLWPYILDKIMFWQVERMLRKIAKKQKNEQNRSEIDKVADLAKKLRKEVEL